jgi:phage tail-like protein
LIKIGRLPDNELSLPFEKISRLHAEIRMEPQGPVLTDLGSSNGTFIGDRRLLPNQPLLLRDGDTFRIGPYMLTYQAPGNPLSSAEPEESTAPLSLPRPRLEPQQEETRRELPSPQPVVSAPRSETSLELEPAPRPTFNPGFTPLARQPMPGSADAESMFLHFLPDIYQENDFLRRFLLIFESLWEPLEHRQDHIEMYFDPRTCPRTFLPWLAGWLGLPYNPRWPESRLRRLLAQGMELYRWRGTRHGLARMIEVCTGLIPTITDVPGQPYVFRIQIALPASSAGEAVTKELLEDLIQTHKPAHAGYILEVIE